MHTVAVVAFPGVVPFDLATACEVFGRARHETGEPAYAIRVCGTSATVTTSLFDLQTRFGLDALEGADSIVVPGTDDLDRPVPPALLDALRASADRGARLASICTGAFLLAAAGLLDGRRATTHWLAAPELARRHPGVSVDPLVLYVDEGSVLTSAGAAAGLDLCLHLVRRDFGAAMAAATARVSVMPLERAGGQAQFIVHEAPAPDGTSLEPVLRWVESHLDRPLSVPQLARRTGMSTRTFVRRFREQTGTTPAHWLVRTRVHRAQQLLETTAVPVEQIAEQVGFGSVTTLRERFREVVGTSPQAYRRAFRSDPPSRGA